MSSAESALAFHRFGLGPRPGDLERIGDDPRGALAAEIATPDVALLQGPPLVDSAAAIAEFRIFLAEKQRARRADSAMNTPDDTAAMAEADSTRPAMDSADPAMEAPMDPQDKPRPPSVPQWRIFRQEVAARIQRVAEAEIGFAERLAIFWANHFAVAINNPIVRASAGAFEREAIRPHIFGYFEDMLLAATRHPAMLVYLDNTRSFGPNSRVGERNRRGLNENHAREILELHTVGVDAGYTQQDVTAFAHILTGWTVGLGPQRPQTLGRFTFNRQRHEPGDQTVMGVVYPEGGVEQGEDVLYDLAAHAGTARQIARKLAGYFVSDNPPESLVHRLQGVFMDTGGDLMAVTLALVESDEAWIKPNKLKTPQEFMYSALRAIQVRPRPHLVLAGVQSLGQPIWNPPSPEGFSNESASWLAPDALTNRLDLAEQLAQRASMEEDPADLVFAILGPGVSEETHVAVSRAESPAQGLALLLMSAEFQRR